MWTPTGSTFSMLQMVMALPFVVAHDLVLDFLPACDALLDQNLVNTREYTMPEAAISRSCSSGVGDAAAGAAERDAGRMMTGRPISPVKSTASSTV